MTLKQYYKYYTSLHWEIGFLDNTLNGVVSGEPLIMKVVTHDYPKSWFADPFILDVTNTQIILLVEEVTVTNRKGRISKLVIDRALNHVISKKIILERPGHLSFPVIYRKDGHIYICPENSADGSLNIYEYNPCDDSIVFVKEICDKPLTDAIITDYFGKNQLFTTDTEAPNGFKLDQYEWDEEQEKYVYRTSTIFDEHIARMAGYFFKIGDKVYRPAQESNTNYGHGMSIQETTFSEGKWHFKEVRRLTSPSEELPLAFHTFNTYKGVVVVDVLGYRFPRIKKVLGLIAKVVKKILGK